MPEPTIKDAIHKVISESDHPMTAKQAYDAIVNQGLYEFGAKAPVSVVQSTIRKHTEGVDSKKSSSIKLFKVTADKRYTTI